VRLSADGVNAECASADGKRCLRNTDPRTCAPWMAQKVDTVANPLPLRCGEQHKRVWGITGYDQRRHWCGPAKQALIARGEAGWMDG